MKNFLSNHAPPAGGARTRSGLLARTASLFLALCLLAPAASAFGSKGEKNYKRGLEFESAQQWEKAVEEFALAVAAQPSNAEYQLHYRRSIFNASQLIMQQGATLLERGDYLGAYNSFRRAYSYDASNELARSMMERALKLQMGKDGPAEGDPGQKNVASTTAFAPAAFRPGADGGGAPAKGNDDALAPARAEQLQVITYSGDLEDFIKLIARQLRLNVVFDRDFPKRNVEVDLQEVTAAQALDYTFITQGLFFQKLSSHTILVADQVKRPQYQQLVLRTFYLYNVDPNEAKLLIQASIPPQAGRQPVITANKSTNSLTIRDTPENVKLVGELLKSVDKERSEVVMDVNIYEVSRTDLMQLGNQVGTADSLSNLGGLTKGLTVFGGSRSVVTQGLGAVAAPTALGAALVVPAMTMTALQRKDNTRLIASTQVHAFDGEKSTAHIGQRVPVQTATVAPYGSISTGDAEKQPGVTQGLFGGNGYPVIQYEKTGLTLEFTPQVFPNLDVQVKMSIKSNDVTNTGAANLTPTFTERNIEGTARIQNNRTMMIASVAQNQHSRGREGLPVLGLVPVLGRLFTAPRRNDQQTDIVIAVTPHVMRAPAVTPSDEEMRPSGTLQTPTTGTLEAMLQETRREEQLAAARLIPTNRVVELPDAEAPSFVPAPKSLLNHVAARGAETDAPGATKEAVYEGAAIPHPSPAANPPARTDVSNPTARAARALAPEVTAGDESPQEVRTPATRQRYAANPPTANTLTANPSAANSSTPNPPAPNPSAASPSAADSPAPGSVVEAKSDALPVSAARSAAELRLVPEARPLRVGERRQLRLLLKTDAPLGLVSFSLRFDPRLIAVRSFGQGNLFAGPADASLTQSVSPEGFALVSVAPSAGAPALTGAGVLLVVEVEALGEGAEALSLDAEDVHVVAADGRRVLLKVTSGRLSVTR
jgi:general secretion pathway protein D